MAISKRGANGIYRAAIIAAFLCLIGCQSVPVVVEPAPEEAIKEKAPDKAPPLPAKKIEVLISWEPTLFYNDGEKMIVAEISHYMLFSGDSKEALEQVAEIQPAGFLSYKIYIETGAAVFVAVKATDIYGIESDYSNVLHLKATKKGAIIEEK